MLHLHSCGINKNFLFKPFNIYIGYQNTIVKSSVQVTFREIPCLNSIDFCTLRSFYTLSRIDQNKKEMTCVRIDMKTG